MVYLWILKIDPHRLLFSLSDKINLWNNLEIIVGKDW